MKQIFSIITFIVAVLFANSNEILSKDIIAVYENNGTWTAINKNGNIVYENYRILDIETYSEDLLGAYIFDKNNKPLSVYFDDQGKRALTAPQSDIPLEFCNGRAMAIHVLDSTGKEAEFGFINKAGNVAIPIKYLRVRNFSENFAYVMNRKERGIIDTNGKFIIKLDSGFAATYFSEGLIAISDIRIAKLALMDTSGQYITDFKFDELGSFSEGLCKAYFLDETGFGYINKQGITVIGARFDEAKEFREGRAFVAVYNKEFDVMKWATIDKDGILLTAYMFDSTKYFSENLSAIHFDNTWKYMDATGKIVIDDNFIFAGTFKNGLALVVTSDNKKYYINKKGERVFEIPDTARAILDCRTNERFGKKY